MYGNGSFGKVNNNVIDNNTINPLKLTGSDGDFNKYLSADGSYKIIPSGNFTSTTNVVNSNFDDNSISISKLVDGVSKTYVDNKVISNANITDNTISISKLNYPNEPSKYLSGDGTFKEVSSGSTFNPSTLRLNTITNSGDIALSNFKITGLANGTVSTDAVNKSQLDGKLSNISASFNNATSVSNQVSGVNSHFINVHANLNVDYNKIINVKDPTNNQDGANKFYVDNSFTTNYNSRINTSISSYNTTNNIRGKINNVSITNTSFMIYVDLTKVHSFAIMGTTGGSVNILYTFPNIGDTMYFKILYFSSGEKSATYYVSNNGTNSPYYGGITINLINGVLKIAPAGETYTVYEL
jgi:hypothetical protein